MIAVYKDQLSINHRSRAPGGLPVIMLTARSENIDRTLGLAMGANDHLANRSTWRSRHFPGKAGRKETGDALSAGEAGLASNR